MLSSLGFPAVGPHRRFVVAIAVDALGSGVFLPVSILYFLATTPLSLTRIGLALSVSAALQLPLGPLVGGLVDRVGPKRVLLAANVLEAIGFIGYVFAGSFTSVLVAAAVVQLGQTAFWGSFSPVVAMIAAPGERERWFGFLGALRNASFAVGGIAASLAITIGTTTAYTAVVLLNATSYVLAFALILGVPRAHRPHAAAGEVGEPSGWSQVLHDRAYLLLVVTNYTYATSAMALNIVIPVYVTQSLGLPGWVAGAIFTLNTVMIGLGQGLVVTLMEGSVRANIVALGCLLSAASYVVLLSADWASVGVGIGIVLVGAAVYTGGELFAGPVLSALSTDAAPLHLRGRYVSLYQMSWTVSMTIAPVTLTWLLERGAAALWAALTVVALAGAALSGLLRRLLAQAGTTVPDTRVVAR
ncbi:MAG: MFS transporter [Nocardioidaceae bacterium]